MWNICNFLDGEHYHETVHTKCLNNWNASSVCSPGHQVTRRADVDDGILLRLWMVWCNALTETFQVVSFPNQDNKQYSWQWQPESMDIGSIGLQESNLSRSTSRREIGWYWVNNERHEMIIALCLLCLLVISLLFVLLVAFTPKPRSRSPSETTFRSCAAPNPQALTSLHEDPQVDLTLVVPAYHEASRLPAMLRESIAYLQERGSSYEVIVVDDGSKDHGQTAQVALDVAKELLDHGGEHVRVVSLKYNRGKGGAVTHGVLFSRGSSILFADADAASKFSDLGLLEHAMKKIRTPSGHGLVVGSRAHMVNTAAVVQRSFLRNFLMRSFHIYLQLLGISSIEDTQCGFKLFTRNTARVIFPSMHVEGWIFDIELITLALLAAIPTVEVPITWNEVEGSKMQLFKDSIQMALDLLIIRANYALGRWQRPPRIQ